MSIELIRKNWENTEACHKELNDSFANYVNSTPELKELRDWVEENKWGFGERSFYWMWKLLVNEMPTSFNFLEVGVFRGQIMALIQLLSATQKKLVRVTGITPLTTEGGYWESDYKDDITKIHKQFSLGNNYIILEGFSNNPYIIKLAKKEKYDLLYIDGGHEYETVKEDLDIYLPMLNPGGYLVIDDSACRFNLPNGYFRGHESVSKAVDEFLPPFTQHKDFEFLFNIVHNRVWRKKQIKN